MNDFLEWLHSTKLVFIGMLGAAFIAWFSRRDIRSKTDAAVFILFGGANAHFVTPLLIHLTGWPADTVGAVGFGVGSVGGLFAKWAWHFVRSGELTKLIHSKFGGGQ